MSNYLSYLEAIGIAQRPCGRLGQVGAAAAATAAAALSRFALLGTDPAKENLLSHAHMPAGPMEDGKAAAALAGVRRWRTAAAFTAIACLALLGLQVQPLGLSLRFLAMPTSVSGGLQLGCHVVGCLDWAG